MGYSERNFRMPSGPNEKKDDIKFREVATQQDQPTLTPEQKAKSAADQAEQAGA